jgi:hypothetical protein
MLLSLFLRCVMLRCVVRLWLALSTGVLVGRQCSSGGGAARLACAANVLFEFNYNLLACVCASACQKAQRSKKKKKKVKIEHTHAVARAAHDDV